MVDKNIIVMEEEDDLCPQCGEDCGHYDRGFCEEEECEDCGESFDYCTCDEDDEDDEDEVITLDIVSASPPAKRDPYEGVFVFCSEFGQRRCIAVCRAICVDKERNMEKSGVHYTRDACEAYRQAAKEIDSKRNGKLKQTKTAK